jgi:hypothetical protein
MNQGPYSTGVLPKCRSITATTHRGFRSSDAIRYASYSETARNIEVFWRRHPDCRSQFRPYRHRAEPARLRTLTPPTFAVLQPSRSPQ